MLTTSAALPNGRASHGFAAVVAFASSLGFPDPVHIGGGIFACLATITPEMAMEILAEHHIENNRNKRQGAIKKYMADMSDGLWRLNHQGIAFGRHELLCDGQNRLTACINNELPFDSLVFFNVPDEAMPTLDSGAGRTQADAAKIINRNDSHRSVAAARVIACGPNPPAFSRQKIFQIVDELADVLQFIDEHLPSTVPGITTAPVLGAIGRAWFHVERTRLAEFCKCLASRVVRADEDTAAAALLNWAANATTAGGSAQPEAFGKAEAAIAKFVERTPIQKLYAQTRQHPSGRLGPDGKPLRVIVDIYPLPQSVKERLGV